MFGFFPEPRAVQKVYVSHYSVEVPGKRVEHEVYRAEDVGSSFFAGAQFRLDETVMQV